MDDDYETPIGDILKRRETPKVSFSPEPAEVRSFKQEEPVAAAKYIPSDTDMSISDDNVFYRAFVSLKYALMIGFLLAIFQLGAVRKMFKGMEGVLKDGELSIYGFFIFLTIGTVAGKVIENV